MNDNLTPLMQLSRQVRQNADRVAQAIQAARPKNHVQQIEAIAKENQCTAQVMTAQNLAESEEA